LKQQAWKSCRKRSGFLSGSNQRNAVVIQQYTIVNYTFVESIESQKTQSFSCSKLSEGAQKEQRVQE
jgi:hypothetical protein